jgi:hypothetical protein
MAKRRRKSLGSSSAVHTQQASKAADEIEKAAALTVNRSRNGRCTAATMAYADMQQAIGRYEAHTRSGGKAWEPLTAIRDAAGAYNDFCVRESRDAGMGRRRRKARRR